MPFVKISGLTTATAVSATNQFEINQNGGSRSATVAQVAAFARTSATDPVVLPAGTVSAPALTFTGDTNTGIYSPAAGTIAFTEGGVESMRITNAGDVGIGTAAPAGRLDVVTGTYRAYFDDAGGAFVRLNGVNAANTVYGPIAVNGSQVLITTGVTERMRIDASGNVGIGTAAPAAKLDLAGDYKEGVVTANTGTSYTINLATGTVQVLTLTGNCTFTFPAVSPAGRSFLLLLRQDGTGNRSATWPATVRWPGGTAPVLTTTANRTDKFVFTSDGTNWLGSNAGQNYTP